MSGLPVPLGVRFYGIESAGEWWVTRWVEDLSFRSVVPGGFSSATITVHVPRSTGFQGHPDALGFARAVALFTRIQIVDLRNMEVAWEGRIEDPARQTEPDVWQIGALGSMVAASDIQRPVFYIDSSLDRWATGDLIDGDGNIILGDNPDWAWSVAKDDQQRSVTITFKTGYVIFDGNDDFSIRWDSHGYDQPIARFTLTQKGFGPNTTQDNNTDVIVGIQENSEIQVTQFSAFETTKTSVIGTNFTDENTRFVVVGADRHSGAAQYEITSDDVMTLRIREPKIVGQRYDRFGNRLVTASSYPATYVTVAQVVEDVLGRFLVGAWYELGLNTPWAGSVRGTDAFIDDSDTTQILHLAYPDGTTAADILNDLASQVQTDAYWAIWESAWGAGIPNSDFGVTSGFRFEWATWPANAGYFATSQDGFEGQPDGSDLWNFIFFRYPDTGDTNAPHITTTWQGSADMAPELSEGRFTRAITVNKSDPTDSSTADTLRDAYLNSKKQVKNAGTLTVKRPIQLFDPGTTDSGGGVRMVDPWLIRPGRLIRITDLPPRAGTTDLSYGSTAPSEALNGTVFRVVATEYHSSDNSCRLELDQVATWQIPTQIDNAGSSSTIRTQ